MPPLLYTGSLGHARDYVFVDDVVRALVAVGFDARAEGGVFNMAPRHTAPRARWSRRSSCASGAACRDTDPERAAAIAANGYEVVAGPPARALDRQHCDAGLLRTKLGFRPTVPLGVGLDRTIAAVMVAHGLAAPSNGAARGYRRAAHT